MKKNILIIALSMNMLVADNNISSIQSTPIAASVVNTKTKSLINKESDTAWVDQKVEEIKPMRIGLDSSSLATLKSPFIIVKPKPKEGLDKTKGPSITDSTTNVSNLAPTKKDMSKEPLTLQIVLNSSALINGSWLKENDTFRGYKLTQIQNNYVVLERKSKKIKLFIAQKNDNINISTK